MRALTDRLVRLENRRRAGGGPVVVVVCRAGETVQEAILRTCGPAGLPPGGPDDPPHLILRPAEMPKREEENRE